MTTLDVYFDAVKERLLTDPLVVDFRIDRERIMVTDGHIRARLTLDDGSLLEFSEYVQVSSTDEIVVATYSYHWADLDGHLIWRWDNTPHYPDSPYAPHHIHNGQTDDVIAGSRLHSLMF